MRKTNNIVTKLLVSIICVSMLLSSVVSYSQNGTITTTNQETNQTTELDQSNSELNNGNEETTTEDSLDNQHETNNSEQLINQTNTETTSPSQTEEPVAVEAGNGTNITLSFLPQAMEGGKPKMNYYYGERIVFNNFVGISGDTAVYPEAYMLVKIPYKYIADVNVSGSNSLTEMPTRVEYQSKDGYNIYKFTYKQLSGGDWVSIPMDIKLSSLQHMPIPNKYQLSIKQELYSKDNQLLAEATSEPTNHTWPALTPKLTASTHSQEGGGAKPGDPNRIDPNNTKPVHVSSRLESGIGVVGLGEPGGKVRLFIQLPKEGVYTDKREEVTYISEKRLAYIDVDNYKTRQDFHIQMEFPNELINTKFPFTAWVSPPDSNGNLPTEPRPTDMKAFGTIEVYPTPYRAPFFNKVGSKGYFGNNKPTTTRFHITADKGSEKLFIKEITDTPESPYLQLSTLYINIRSNDLGKNKLYGTNKQNTEVLIAENVVAKQEYSLKGYKSFRLVFDTPIEVTNGIELAIPTTLDPNMWNTSSNDIRLYNSGTIKYSNQPNGSLKSDNVRDFTQFKKYTYNFYVQNHAGGGSKYLGGLFYTYPTFGLLSPEYSDGVSNRKMVTLLPEGIEFVSNKDIKDVIYNYKGTGKTALICDKFGTTTLLKVGYNAKEGDYVIETFFTADPNDGSKGIWDTGSSSLDIYDINDNGNKSEDVGKYTTKLSVKLPQEVTSHITVSDDNKHYGRNINGVYPGEEASYKATVTNNTPNKLNYLEVINILPRKGDKTIVPNANSQYVDRNSQYDLYLTGPVTGPAGYTITYLTEQPAEGVNNIKNQTFLPASSIKDWSTVTGFKAVSNSGTSLNSSQSVEFQYKAKSLYDHTMPDNAVAYNTFAHSQNGNTWYETAATSTPIIKYLVNGKIFFDKNQDGTMGGEDYGLQDYEVSLTHIPTGNVTKGVTDQNGDYSVKGLMKGNYSLSLSTKEGDTISPKITSTTGVIVNQFNPTSGQTDQFELNSTKKTITKNGGIYKDQGTLGISKTDEKGNPLASVVFVLTDTVTNEKFTLTTDGSGKAIHFGLVLGRTYTLQETSAPEGYFVPNETTPILATIDLTYLKKTISNRLMIGNIQILVHESGNESIVIQGAQINLQKVDELGSPVGNPIVSSTNKQGIVIFPNVEYGTYIVTQTTTMEGYSTNSTPLNIAINSEGETIEKTIENRRIKSEVTITVVDKDDPNKKLEGVPIEIVKVDKSGNPIDTPIIVTTDKNGEAKLEKVPSGDYEIVQKDTIPGYTPNTTPIKISITDETPITKTITNAQIRGKIKIEIVDRDDHSVKLANSKVRIEESTGPQGSIAQINSQPIEALTDSNGQILLDNMMYGTYTITQIETLDGYILNDTPVEATIKAEGEMVSVLIENGKIMNNTNVEEQVNPEDQNPQLKPPTVTYESGKAGKVTRTGDDFNYFIPLIAAIITLTIIVAILIYRLRKTFR